MAAGLPISLMSVPAYAERSRQVHDLYAGTDAGTLTTVPMHFTGGHLELNLNASRGSASVELLDVAGKPIAGYGESDPLNTDSLRAKVLWKEKGDISKLAGRPVSLRFHLQQAELYSFAFRE